MKILIWTAVIFIHLVLSHNGMAENFINNINNAEKISKKENKPILLIFSIKDCLYCDILKKEIKQRSIDDYIICIVNTENNVKLAQQHMVKFFPTSVILEPKIVKNLEISRFDGYSSDYWKWLGSEKNSLRDEIVEVSH
jgi:hypothetical protein